MIVDQMLVEDIRVFYPKLYTAIRDHPELFLQSKKREWKSESFAQRTTSLIQKSIEGIDLVNVEQIARVLVESLFPRVSDRGYGPDWDQIWAKEQRICSTRYFSRYFHYGVVANDVSDSAVGDFLSIAVSADEAAMDRKLRELTSVASAARFVEKLRVREDQVDQRASATLATAIARNGALLPRDDGRLIPDLTYMQAAIFVAHMVKKSSTNLKERGALSHQIISEAEPLSFALQCFRWLRKADDEEEADRIVAPEIERQLGGALADRMRKMAHIKPPYMDNPGDAPALLWAWNEYGSPGEVAAFLRERFERDGREVDDFLAAYVPTAWGVESGIPHKSDFGSDAYDSVARLIDPEFIRNKLRERYGSELDEPKFRHVREASLGYRVAHQFCYVHQRAEVEKTTQEDANEAKP